WYNRHTKTAFAFSHRGQEPPDLVYTSEQQQQLMIEITVAYYDAGHATMLWQNARGVQDAPNSWWTRAPDDKLIHSVNEALRKKSAKSYPPHCVLVLVVYADLTSAEEFAEAIPRLEVP